MAKGQIFWPNHFDAASLSGGTWRTPLAWLQDRRLTRAARTSSLEESWFVVDLGRERTIQLVAIVGHTCDLDGRARIRGYADADLATLRYDSEWQDIFPACFTTFELEWEDDNWWSGRILPEDLAEDPRQFVHILKSQQFLRYWRVDFENPSNPAGYIDVGRVFMGPGMRPVRNFGRTPAMTVETNTRIERSLGDVRYADRRPSMRVVRVRFEAMDQVEGVNWALRLMRDRGVDRDLFFCLDPGNPLLRNQTSFLGTLRTLSPLDFFDVDSTAVDIEIIETVG